MCACNCEHPASVQDVFGQPLGAGNIGLAAIENGFEQWNASPHCVADDPKIGCKLELIFVETLDEIDARGLKLGAHGRVNVCIATGNLVAACACELGDSAHESAANAKDMNVHGCRENRLEPVELAAHSTGPPESLPGQILYMSRRNHRSANIQNPQPPFFRAGVAQVAARLLADGSVDDFGAAKRKAIKQLGLPDSHPLPTDAQVATALREYQQLFLGDEHAQHLTFLREAAVELMVLLAPFRPHLTGSVLDGTAGPRATIDLLLFADSAKDVEIFLLNENIRFSFDTPRDERIEAVFVLEDEDAVANLIVLRPQDERHVFKHRDGRSRARARLESVAALLQDSLAQEI